MEDDLSFLHPRSQSPLPPKSASGSNREPFQDKSQPNDVKSRDWRPLSLKTPLLLAVLVLSLLLFACIEALAQRSHSKGGLAFYSSLDEIPGAVSFTYSYLPTILATLFSLLWNWIDLDVKRVQPWIELSRPTGAAAKHSILLDYSSYFLAIVPARAARLMHWPVFFSGSAAILILWVLTPLQSSLFGESTVSHTVSTTVTARSQLLPADEQSQTGRILQLSYTIGILNQSYPNFTTSEYALLPFYLGDNVTTSTTSTNWTAETTKLWAETNCSDVKINYLGVQDYGEIGYNFTGTKGCSLETTFVHRDKPYPKLVYRDNNQANTQGRDDWVCISNSGERYYSDTSYSVFIYWYEPIDPTNTTTSEFKFTAAQCEISYYKQQVLVTVASNTLQPFHESIKPMSKKDIIGPDEFNNASFVASFPSVGGSNARSSSSLDYSDMLYPNPPTNSALESQMDSIYRYALLGLNYDIDTFSDKSKLEGLMQKAVQQWLSIAISMRLGNETTADDAAKSTTILTGIIMSRPFAIASEVLLLLGAVVLGYLCYIMKPSTCSLDKIPSSIDGFISMAHNNPGMAKLFKPMDTADEKLLEKALGDVKLHIATNCPSGYNKLQIMQETPALPDLEEGMVPKPYYEPVKPWVLRRGTGVALVAVLVAAVVVLSYFKRTERRNNGLQRPSENFEVLQLLENYIPTIFATLVEPFWILLARTMCIFQPFKDLWKGKSPASRSIEAGYTSVPPQLALVEAITTRKILLSLLCFAALLANVLAIGLSALFNERPVAVYYPQQFKSLYQSELNSSTILELVSQNTNFLDQKSSLFMSLANITYSSQLSPWTSTEYYFQPVDIIGADENSTGDEYTVRTRGFGADVSCTSYPSSTHRLWSVPYAATPNQYNLTCLDPIKEVLSVLVLTGSRSKLEGASSMSTSSIPYMNYVKDYSYCRPNITFAWARSPEGMVQNNTITTSYAKCQPIFQTAMFNTTVNKEGQVLGYQRVGDMESTLDYHNSTQYIDLLFATFNFFIAAKDGEWTDNSSIGNWMSQFLYLDIGSRDFLNPKLPVPDPEMLIPSLRRVYALLFPSYLSTITNLLQAAEGNTIITGTRRTQETRIFMDNTAFIITMTVLAINCLIALAFYLPESLYVLPRLPSSAASILAYTAPSRAVRDGKPSSGWGDQTFSFGRYLGYDGKAYVGIEMDQYVVEKDISLGSYKPLLPTSLTNNISERTPSLNGDDRDRPG